MLWETQISNRIQFDEIFVSSQHQDRAAKTRQRYPFGPFLFDSPVEISELQASPDADGLRVQVDRGGVPQTIAGGLAYGAACQVSPAEYLLRVPGTASFHAAYGRQVTIEAESGAIPADVSAYLLGSVFGALCHQSGMLPLHASAVAGAGGVTAFLADSGAGKSTLAAFLARRGYPIVADDICLFQPADDDLRVVPVAGWLKLWRQSFDQLGETPEERHRTFSADDKYRVYRPPAALCQPRLANAVFLDRSASVDVPRLEPMAPGPAIARLMDAIYLPYITELTGAHPRAFRQCAQILSGARAWRLVGPWGWDAMEETLDLLGNALLGPPPAQG